MEGEISTTTIVDRETVSGSQDSVPMLRKESSHGEVMARLSKHGLFFLDASESDDWLYGDKKSWGICLPQQAFTHKVIQTEEGDFKYTVCEKNFDIKSLNSICDIQQENPMRKRSPKCDRLKTNFKFNLDSVGKQHSEYNECGNALSQKTDIIQHPKTPATMNSYECYQCRKAFTRSSSLIRHQIIHTGEKPYKCSECGKFFNRRTNLTKHQKIHTKAKACEANKCGKAFSNSEDINKNPRPRSGDNPFECVNCRKSFNRSSSLIRHQFIHTGEKPFKCKECEKTFNRNSNLIKHQKLHTREKTCKRRKCSITFGQSANLIQYP
ncbi:zinc finger protein 215 isoform X2 [Tamandua tetradactyla]